MDVDKLISLVQSHDLIYNKNSKDFKNKQKREEVWSLIARELGTTSELCQRRWISIRERFNKTVRMMDAPSGSGATEVSEWVHFDALSFLRGHLQRRKQRSSFSEASNASQFSPTSPNLSSTCLEFDFSASSVSNSIENIYFDTEQVDAANDAMLEDCIIEEPEQSAISINTPSPQINRSAQSSQGLSRAKKRKAEDLSAVLSEVNSTFTKYVESTMKKKTEEDGRVSGFLEMQSSILRSMGPTRKRRTIRRIMDILDEEEANVDED